MAEFVYVSFCGMIYDMSVAMEILRELWNTELKYKGMTVNLFGVPRFQKYSSNNLSMAIYRLKERKLIEKELTGLVLSKQGKEYVRRKNDSLKQFEKPKNFPKDKNLLLMFDIPTGRKGEREWLRWHLKKFGYEMVQKSVWVGPSPLPKDFSDYLEHIKLKKCIKTFKLAKPYIDK